MCIVLVALNFSLWDDMRLCSCKTCSKQFCFQISRPGPSVMPEEFLNTPSKKLDSMCFQQQNFKVKLHSHYFIHFVREFPV